MTLHGSWQGKKSRQQRTARRAAERQSASAASNAAPESSPHGVVVSSEAVDSVAVSQPSSPEYNPFEEMPSPSIDAGPVSTSGVLQVQVNATYPRARVTFSSDSLAQLFVTFPPPEAGQIE